MSATPLIAQTEFGAGDLGSDVRELKTPTPARELVPVTEATELEVPIGEAESDTSPPNDGADALETPVAVDEVLPGAENVLQLRSDTQTFDRDEGLFRARGNV
ncbi:MAG: hypothetical protein AAF978_08600 [Cyanobacteria bacterium P01_E01_bin.48]